MKLKKIIAYEWADCPSGYNIIFVPSGFEGGWLEVCENYSYLTSANYATEEQTIELQEKNK